MAVTDDVGSSCAEESVCSGAHDTYCEQTLSLHLEVGG